jgi:CDP-glycerol glycerophosphotransferase (TagB/SpsB family)
MKLLVLAAKFSEIREELPKLFAAAGGQPGIRLIIKTHPAETTAPYEALASGISNISIAPADADLARLLAAADALVTMNSTVAVDGLVLDVPALVIGWPTNLTPFVEAGAMMGGPDLDVPDALRRLLYDQSSRDDLHQRATAFARTYQIQADGRAAERASNEILATIT